MMRMRTRDEQILELVDTLKKPVCRPDYPASILKVWLEVHILEAERRAEQRVRTEIGRDSERLDWLERAALNTDDINIHCLLNTCGDMEFGISVSDDYGPTLRDIIDASREDSK